MIGEISVVNVGLPVICEGIPNALQLDWRPPAFGDAIAAALALALDDELTRTANEAAIAAVHSTRPQWVRVRPASDEIPWLRMGHRLLHAGPPTNFADVCGPVAGALIGAVLFEGWATNPDAARELLASGAVAIAPCHDYGAVGPMAGVIAPSMPVIVVQDGEHRAFATLNEGLGKVLRFGAFDAEVQHRLRWMRDVLGPTLDAALLASDPIDTTSLFGQALSMGDEGHNRNVAATSLLTRKLAPLLSQLESGKQVLEFLAANDHFALNLSMAAAKLCLDQGRYFNHSTLVTAMCRNGVEFGIRVSGTGDQWFTAPVGPAEGLLFPGYTEADANPDLGDSAITETLGIGGFAMAAAPAITRFIGGTPEDALAATEKMARITMRPHPAFPLPPLGFRGSPSGIDVLKVLDAGELPIINTGIAHKEAGVGQIGAGIALAPPEVFLQAVRALAKKREET